MTMIREVVLLHLQAAKIKSESNQLILNFRWLLLSFLVKCRWRYFFINLSQKNFSCVPKIVWFLIKQDWRKISQEFSV